MIRESRIVEMSRGFEEYDRSVPVSVDRAPKGPRAEFPNALAPKLELLMAFGLRLIVAAGFVARRQA